MAQGADAEDRLVLGLVGSPVFGVGVAGSGEGRVVKDHGEGGLNAAEAGCWRNPQEPFVLHDCLLFTINALRIKAKGCRRNDSQRHMVCDS